MSGLCGKKVDMYRVKGLSALTLYQTTIIDSFKLKEFAEEIFKFDYNSRKFSKQVENTVGKGEISHSVFKRLALQTRKNQGLFGKGLIVFQAFVSFWKFRCGLSIPPAFPE